MVETTGGFSTIDGRSVLVTPSGREVGSADPSPPRRRGRGGSSSPPAQRFESELLRQSFSTEQEKISAEAEFRRKEKIIGSIENLRKQSDPSLRNLSEQELQGRLIQTQQDIKKQEQRKNDPLRIGKNIISTQNNPFTAFSKAKTDIALGFVEKGRNKALGFVERFESKEVKSEKKFIEAERQDYIKSIEFNRMQSDPSLRQASVSQLRDISKFESDTASERRAIDKSIFDFENKFGGRQLDEKEFKEAEKRRADLIRDIGIGESNINREAEQLNTRLGFVGDEEFNRVSKVESSSLKQSLRAAGVGAAKGGVNLVFGAASVPLTVAKDPLGFGKATVVGGVLGVKNLPKSVPKTLSSPSKTGEVLGGFVIAPALVGKLVGKANRIVNAAKTETTVSVSVGKVVAKRIKGSENLWEVNSVAKAVVKDAKTGEVLGKTQSGIKSVSISAPTKAEAVKVYSEGFAVSVSQVGSKGLVLEGVGSRVRSAANVRVQKGSEFTVGEGFGFVNPMVRAKATKTKPTVNLLDATFSDFNVKTRVKSEPPTASIFEFKDRLSFDKGQGKRTIVDTKSLLSDKLGYRLTFPKAEPVPSPARRVAGAQLSRDIVEIKDSLSSDLTDNIVSFKSPKKSNGGDVLQINMKAVDSKKAVESLGFQQAKLIGEDAGKGLQKQVKRQKLKDAILGNENQAVLTGTKSISRSASKTTQRSELITSNLGSSALQNRQRSASVNSFSQVFGITTLSQPAQATRTVTANKTRLANINKAVSPNLNIPNFTGGFGALPALFSFDTPKGLPSGRIRSSELGKASKIDFTPSLGSVVTGKKKVVSEKEFQKLRRQQFGGFELRPNVAIKGNKSKDLNNLLGNIF